MDRENTHNRHVGHGSWLAHLHSVYNTPYAQSSCGPMMCESSVTVKASAREACKELYRQHCIAALSQNRAMAF